MESQSPSRNAQRLQNVENNRRRAMSTSTRLSAQPAATAANNMVAPDVSPQRTNKVRTPKKALVSSAHTVSIPYDTTSTADQQQQQREQQQQLQQRYGYSKKYEAQTPQAPRVKPLVVSDITQLNQSRQRSMSLGSSARRNMKYLPNADLFEAPASPPTPRATMDEDSELKRYLRAATDDAATPQASINTPYVHNGVIVVNRATQTEARDAADDDANVSMNNNSANVRRVSSYDINLFPPTPPSSSSTKKSVKLTPQNELRTSVLTERVKQAGATSTNAPINEEILNTPLSPTQQTKRQQQQSKLSPSSMSRVLTDDNQGLRTRSNSNPPRQLKNVELAKELDKIKQITLAIQKKVETIEKLRQITAAPDPIEMLRGGMDESDDEITIEQQQQQPYKTHHRKQSSLTNRDTALASPLFLDKPLSALSKPPSRKADSPVNERAASRGPDQSKVVRIGAGPSAFRPTSMSPLITPNNTITPLQAGFIKPIQQQ